MGTNNVIYVDFRLGIEIYEEEQEQEVDYSDYCEDDILF